MGERTRGARKRGAAAGAAPAQGECIARVIARHGRRYSVLPLDAPVLRPGGALPADGVPASTAAALSAIAPGRGLHAVAGDLVLLRGDERHGLQLCRILDRRSLLFREEDGRTKPLAANVDQVVVVYAPRPPFQRALLWRSLIAARFAGLHCIVVRNKIDLEDADADAALGELADLGAQTLRTDARSDPEGTLARLRPLLDGKASVFVGQSGVGKSSLLNLLLGSSERTGELSRGERGRQTTTAARWFALGADGAIVDSPGFQDFGLDHLAPADLAGAMEDFARIGGACRFQDCLHREEPGCRIRAALAAGALRPERYDFYRELLAHLAAHEQALRTAPKRG